MVEKISNCQEYLLHLAAGKETKKKKYLYLLEILSEVEIQTPHKKLITKPFDVLLGKSFVDFQLQSYSRSPILLRYFQLEFDIPGPIQQLTVGDNPLIHDIMNDETSEEVYVLFTHLAQKICHSYLDVIEHLELAAENDDEYFAFQKQKVTSLLFTELLRNHETKVSKSSSRFPSMDVKYASKDTQSGMIMRYLSENIQEVTLKEAADYFSYQPNYFSRLIQNLFGVTFNQLKTDIKLELAKEQLRLTTKSLEEISQELGYKAVSNFHRNFKSHVGMTPREYRQAHRLF